MAKKFFYIISFLIISSSLPLAQDYTIKEYLEQALPPQDGRKIVLNEALGLLTVTDTPSNHRLIRELISLWDIGPRQIIIEAKFVEVSMTDLDELGIEWQGERSDLSAGGSIDRRQKKGTFFIGPSVPSNSTEETSYSVNPATTGEGFGVYEHNYPNWSGTEFGAPQETAGLGLWLGKTSLSGSEVFSYLRALESRGKANLLSSPKVTTLSGQMANIELADIFPYATSVERTYCDLDVAGGVSSEEVIETYSVDERKVGIFLEVTPVVGEQGKVITLDLHPEVSELVEQKPLLVEDSDSFPDELGWPVIDTRSIQTTVNVESGETIVIGGLIKDEETVTNKKVPILGHIPLLGNLFKYKHVSREKMNLVIFLTATLITADGEEIR